MWVKGNEEDLTPVIGMPHFAPKAKRIIYLFQNGAPSQLESFDYKPLLNKMHGQELPASVRMGRRLTRMTSGQSNPHCSFLVLNEEIKEGYSIKPWSFGVKNLEGPTIVGAI